MPLPQAPQRQTTNTPITPIVGDLLVSVTEEYQRKDIPAYGTPMAEIHQRGKDPRFANHVFVFAEPQQNAREDIYTCYFAAPREDQDLYNFETTQADIGGTRFDAVQRTYIIPRADYRKASPAMGAAMPNLPIGQFSDYASFVLAIKNQRRIDKEFDSHFVVETRTYVRKTTITQIGVDSLNGESLTATATLYHKDEIVTSGLTASQIFALPDNAYWGLQATGFQVSGRQLSSEWYEVTSEKVIGGAFSGGQVAVGTYTTNDNFYWPPVLDTIEFMDWVRKEGGTDIFPRLEFKPEGYQGPTLTTITRTWKSTPFTIPVVAQMQPRRIYYACPFFTLNIPECLHGAVECVCDIGSGDATYTVNSGSLRTYAATTLSNGAACTTWPATLTAFDDQEPFRGGYLRTTRVVTSPAIP
jgi:hypothetical protein